MHRSRQLQRVSAVLAVCASIHAAQGALLMHRPAAALRGLLRLRGGCPAAPPAMSAHGAVARNREPKVVEGETLGPALQRMRRSLSRARDTSALCVIADFDWTLTAFWGPDGSRSDQCHDFILHRCSPSRAWSAEVQAFRALTRQRFGAMAERPKSEQIALAEWWWTSANDMMLKHNLTQDHVREAVQNANTSPRPGAMALLTACISQGIPVAIVSAGLSCVIEEFVRKHDASGSLLSSPLFSIHANVLEFDSIGTLTGERERERERERGLLSRMRNRMQFALV